LMASTAAFAQNNNTGEIVIQGVVPGVWELTVYDINSGYDFDLSVNAPTAGAAGIVDARVGTIYIHSNDVADTNGANAAGSILGTLFVESANAGRMVNNQNLPGIASSAQDYSLQLVDNLLMGAQTFSVTYDDQAALNTFGAYDSTSAANAPWINLNTPARFQFTPTTDAASEEGTYDVIIGLGSANAAGVLQGDNDVRPTASGVYSDVLTFTIMDDA